MHKTIISDTSCFIILSKIGELDLLFKTYKQVTTTFEVATEFGSTLPDWVEITSPSDNSKQKILELHLDKGEASAIALALETPNSTIILDDFKARRVAEMLGLGFTGTLGVNIKAKKMNIIHSVKPYLQKLKYTDFRFSAQLEEETLKEAGE